MQLHALLGQLETQLPQRCGQQEANKLYMSGVSHIKTIGEETHEDDQGDSEFTNLLENTLCCAVWPCRDNPVVGPPDIKATTNCLQKVEYENRELS